ncbi:hypothetical protein ACWFRJ_03735 [Streptomyces sp. NPDC055239]
MTQLRTSAVAATLFVALAAAGCSGSSGGGHSTSPAPSHTGGSTGVPSPTGNSAAPTESNPPGDIPDNQAFVAYRPAGGAVTHFTVKVPEGWARTQHGATTRFTDKLNTVRITTATVSAAPTPGSVTKTTVTQLRTQVANFTRPQVSEVSRHAGRVVRLTYQGDSAKDPVTGKVIRDAFERYAFYRQGHEVDLILSGPVNADNVDPWRIVSDSFTWR